MRNITSHLSSEPDSQRTVASEAMQNGRQMNLLITRNHSQCLYGCGFVVRLLGCSGWLLGGHWPVPPLDCVFVHEINFTNILIVI